MSEHRGTQARATEPLQSNRDPATVLENLYAQVVDIEALARAAETAADALPAPASTRQRVLFRTAETAADALPAPASTRQRVLFRAAEAAADALPAPASARQRVLFGRIQSLATDALHQASASLRIRECSGHSARGPDGGTRKLAAR